MATLLEIQAEAFKAAKETLGEAVLDSRVRTVEDADGNPALRVDVIVKKFDPEKMSLSQKTLLTLELLDYLEKTRDSRFPLVHVIEQAEWALPPAE
jgi:hypothetical protein